MKVVFLQDVVRVARAGEIKEVANGYGRNYLIPRKLAAPADARTMKLAESQIKANAKIAAAGESELIDLAGKLDGQEITIKAKSGVNDRLYGSITAADLAAEIESVLGLVIDRKKVDIGEPIRQLGTYEIAVRLSYDITPTIKLTVISEAPVASRIVEAVPAYLAELIADEAGTNEVIEEEPVAEETAVAEEPAAEETAAEEETAVEEKTTEEPVAAEEPAEEA